MCEGPSAFDIYVQRWIFHLGRIFTALPSEGKNQAERDYRRATSKVYAILRKGEHDQFLVQSSDGIHSTSTPFTRV